MLQNYRRPAPLLPEPGAAKRPLLDFPDDGNRFQPFIKPLLQEPNPLINFSPDSAPFFQQGNSVNNDLNRLRAERAERMRRIEQLEAEQRCLREGNEPDRRGLLGDSPRPPLIEPFAQSFPNPPMNTGNSWPVLDRSQDELNRDSVWAERPMREEFTRPLLPEPGFSRENFFERNQGPNYNNRERFNQPQKRRMFPAKDRIVGKGKFGKPGGVGTTTPKTTKPSVKPANDAGLKKDTEIKKNDTPKVKAEQKKEESSEEFPAVVTPCEKKVIADNKQVLDKLLTGPGGEELLAYIKTKMAADANKESEAAANGGPESSELLGGSFVTSVTANICHLCQVYFNDGKPAKEEHCRTERHNSQFKTMANRFQSRLSAILDDD